jgi:hypothetical protein
MSTDTCAECVERRISDLYGTEQQFADTRPSDSVTHAIASIELRLPQFVQTILDGYADRPALGQRSVQFVTDPSGRPPRPTGSAPWCRTRKLVPTRIFRMSRPRSSSSTSPTCSCSDCCNCRA